AVGARRLGADVEDADDAAPFALLHLREDEPAEADLREQFEVQVGLPHLIGDRLRRPARRLPGIVDEDVDLAELGDDLVAGLADVGRFRYGAADRGDLAAGRPGLDPGLGLVEGSLVASQDRDVGARFGVFLGDCQAQTLAAAGDDRGPAVQPNFHLATPPPGFESFGR